jgi:hypothetical protein
VFIQRDDDAEQMLRLIKKLSTLYNPHFTLYSSLSFDCLFIVFGAFACKLKLRHPDMFGHFQTPTYIN